MVAKRCLSPESIQRFEIKTQREKVLIVRGKAKKILLVKVTFLLNSKTQIKSGKHSAFRN